MGVKNYINLLILEKSNSIDFIEYPLNINTYHLSNFFFFLQVRTQKGWTTTMYCVKKRYKIGWLVNLKVFSEYFQWILKR